MRRLAYILAVAAAAGAVAYFAAREMRFSLPAPLHKAHAGLERDCFTCHNRDRRVDARKCSECHTRPDTGEPLVLTGFARHHAYTDLDCLACHTEHRGVEGRLTRPDHSIDKSDCGLCHERHVGKGFAYSLPRTEHPTRTLHAKHARWQDDCFVCHLKGGGISAAPCTECHEPGTGALVAFTGFAAHHTFVGLDCLNCHLEHRGEKATLLRAGKSFKTAGCQACHERHVGPAHLYALAADRHPEGQVHPAHARWAHDCFACHRRGTEGTECLVCHDPATGKQVELKGFAAHHFQADLKCLDCHTDHRGAAKGILQPGITFAKTDCKTCHAAALQKPAPLDKVPVAVRGSETQFAHGQHRPEAIACAECHPMKASPAHALAHPYDNPCSLCHHGPEQKAPCAQCHRKTADYFAGKLGSELIPRGTHGRSGGVACGDCHRFDRATQAFRPPETACEACHPKSYTPLFVRSRETWRAWRKALDARPQDGPEAQRLQFIARNWYHNDAHADAIRRGHEKSDKGIETKE